MDSIPPDAPAPRLCHVVKRADFEGFGFNLYAGKIKTGQFIGKVDANSPAEAAGLLPGDRIVEVNGINIANENHKQVTIRSISLGLSFFSNKKITHKSRAVRHFFFVSNYHDDGSFHSFVIPKKELVFFLLLCSFRVT